MKDLDTTAARLSAAEQHHLVERIVASPPFARAPQLKDFLLFIVERSARDGAAGINETEIGRQVLRRQQSDFDPSTDNIVRVQARHLRQKLEEYFNGPGRDEPVLLTIPKGSYVPRLTLRESADVKVRGRRYVLWMALGVAALAAVGTAWWLAPGVRRGSPTREGRADPIWAAFARTGRKTSIVLSDSSVSVVQNLLRKRLTLSQYLSPGYPKDVLAESGDARTAEILGEITRHPYTSLNSAIVASRLQLAAKSCGVEVALRFPRDINIREFKSENFLLIGSRRSVPWMELIEGQLNFTLAGDPRSLDFYINNREPRAGEQPAYRPSAAAESAHTDYASIALLPNLSGAGLIMCLQGITGMANEAAEELIDDPSTSPLHRLLRAQPGGSPPRLEILIQATGMSGAPAQVKVIATRSGVAAGN